MKISGIYKIQSIIKPDKIYIGSSSNVNRRWQIHLCYLRKGTHKNLIIQNHYNKYGESDLVFIIIEPCLPEFLIIREQYYIDSFNPVFNILPKAGSCLGVKRSDETKLKISKLHKGRIFSEERKKQMSNARIGKKLSPEHIEKLKYYSGKNHPCFGRKCSEETKRKISIANKGRKVSVETKIKMSEGQKGKVNSSLTRLRISNGRMGIEPWNKGLKYNDETKRKMSESAKKRWSA